MRFRLKDSSDRPSSYEFPFEPGSDADDDMDRYLTEHPSQIYWNRDPGEIQIPTGHTMPLDDPENALNRLHERNDHFSLSATSLRYPLKQAVAAMYPSDKETWHILLVREPGTSPHDGDDHVCCGKRFPLRGSDSELYNEDDVTVHSHRHVEIDGFRGRALRFLKRHLLRSDKYDEVIDVGREL